MADMIIEGNTEIESIKHRIYEVRGLRVMLDRDLADLYGVETKRLNEAVRRNIERFPEDFMFKLNKNEWVFLRSQIVTSKGGVISTDTEDVGVVETSLRSQIATLNNDKDSMSSQIVMTNGRGQHSKYLPFAYTELGIAMLSSVLRSETAIQVNINIMRAFVAIRHAVSALQGVNLKVEQLSHKVDQLNNYVEEILHDQCQRLRTPLSKKMKVSNDINRMQDETNNDIALQIEAINDALDQLREKPSTPQKRIGFKTEKQ